MSDLILRGYQKELIKNTHFALSSGTKAPLVVLPTGAGKTAVFAWMANRTQQKGNRVWFLVHRKELLKQTYDTFEKFDIPLNLIKIGMVKTVANKVDTLDPPELIVIDEAHHSVAKTYQTIIDHCPQSTLIGLTATPSRLDGKPLDSIYDTLVLGPSTQDLIDMGYLSPYRQIVSEVGLTDLRKRAGEFVQSDAEEQLMQRAVYGNVIDTYRQFADGKQAIYFCTTVKHSKATAEEFRLAGISAEHFDAKTPAATRDQIVQRFRSGETRVLTNVDLIGEGFDMPACDCVGMLRPTASLTIYLQQAGRALRPAPNKTAVLIDHVGNVNRHGLPTDPRDWSLTKPLAQGRPRNQDGSLQTRVCKACFGVYESSLGDCPYCGSVYQADAQEIEAMEQVKMMELQVEAQAARQQELAKNAAFLMSAEAVRTAKTFDQLMTIARFRGYKPGWAYYQAKERGIYIP